MSARCVRSQPSGDCNDRYLDMPIAHFDPTSGLFAVHVRGIDQQNADRSVEEFGIGGSQIHHQVAVYSAEPNEDRGGKSIERGLGGGPRLEPRRSGEEFSACIQNDHATAPVGLLSPRT